VPLRIEEGFPFSVLPTFSFSIYSSAAFWKANLTETGNVLRAIWQPIWPESGPEDTKNERAMKWMV